MKAAYFLEQVAFAYEDRSVLCVERLKVKRGELVALVGPNGSGKTTLLHIMAFLNIPQEGKLLFFGEPLTRGNLLAFRRKTGLLLQNPYLFHTSVLSNVVSGLKIRGIRGRKAKRAALAALDRVGLSGFEKRHAGSLSGGEAQRVALARTLVLEPEVLLLDEPSNHMDSDSVRRMEEIVLQFNRKQGKTIILATHQLLGVAKSVNRVFNVSEGRISE
jgi:tungstate transport system ATP-binding protein